MKFAMYLIDLETGDVSGSNDIEAIGSVVKNEPDRYRIIHGTYGQVQTYPSDSVDIKELKVEGTEDEDDDIPF